MGICLMCLKISRVGRIGVLFFNFWLEVEDETGLRMCDEYKLSLSKSMGFF